VLPHPQQGAGTTVAREVEAGRAVTALALPFGGHVLFAGTEGGAVRGYRYPLTGEFYEVSLPLATSQVAENNRLWWGRVCVGCKGTPGEPPRQFNVRSNRGPRGLKWPHGACIAHQNCSSSCTPAPSPAW
jgi:hypothetical protein